MAIFKADLTPELAQVKTAMGELLEERVEPMIEQTLDRGVEEIEKALNKASFEMQEAIKQMSQEADHQRRLLVRDLTLVLAVGVILIGAIGVGLIAAYKFW